MRLSPLPLRIVVWTVVGGEDEDEGLPLDQPTSQILRSYVACPGTPVESF